MKKRLVARLVELEVKLKLKCTTVAVKVQYIPRLHDLVHALGAQCALDQVTHGYGANKRGKTGILALLFGGAVLEDLCWAEGRLDEGRRSLVLLGGKGRCFEARRGGSIPS